MQSFADLLGRDRRSETVACRVGTDSHVYTYDRFCTTAWKTAHVLRRLGVHENSVVGVVPAPDPKALLAVLGTGLLGATARLDPPREFDGRALVAPAEVVAEYDLPPGGQRVGFGGDPEDPTVAHYEEQVWGENPVLPPEAPGPEARVVLDEAGDATQGDVVTAARAIVDRENVGEGSIVALRVPLSSARAIAGALAPIVAGGTLVFGVDAGNADFAIGERGCAGDRVVDLQSIPL
jgi:hypothetical protein